MPMDIRAYFSKTPESKSSSHQKTPGSNTVTKSAKSRKRVIIDSDSDEEDSKSRSETKGKNSQKKVKCESEDKSKYFEISKNEVSSILGKRPIKRIEQQKVAKKGKQEDLIGDIEWDDDDFLLAENSVITKSSSSSTVSSLKDSLSRAVSNKDEGPHSSSKEKPDSKILTGDHLSPKDQSCKLSQIASPKKTKVIKGSPKKDNSNSISPSSKLLSPEKAKRKAFSTKLHELSPEPEEDPQPTTTKIVSPKEHHARGEIEKNKTSAPSLKNVGVNESIISSPKPISRLKKQEVTNNKTKINKQKNGGSDRVSDSHRPQKSSVIEDNSCMLWVDKYKPANLKQIIGQQGEKSNVNKLVKWLRDWFSNHSGNKKIPRPSPWAKDDSGAYFKAALLSGPPGVGKTTTAHLVCKELGMDVVEFNASDTRSKKLLKEEISDLLKSKSLSGFALGDGEVSKKHVLVMDEVDGMAGNEDRGGVQELIQLIKSARVPIICMCNDRNHPKIRSLANYCFDLRFSKPRAEQIKGAMMTVCFKEGLKIEPNVLSDIIVNTNQDIRLILNHLSVLAAQKTLNLPVASKYVKIGPWDVLRKVFSDEEHKKMSIFDKCDLFFYDYNIAPLFVQENYLYVQPHSEESKSKRGKMALFAKAADSIASGDLVEKMIRTSSAWGLLPVQAVFSSYVPGEYLAGHMGGQINFPSWLGKNSRRGKLDRMCQEIQAHTRLKVSGSKEAIALDYSNALKERVMGPLVKRGSDGVEDSLSFLKEYSLLREDLESLSEITAWPNIPDPFSKLESKVKSAFTRAYNKSPVVTPFSLGSAVRKGRGLEAVDEMAEGSEELEEDEDEDTDDISKDGMIVMKKQGKEDKKPGETTAKNSKRGSRGGASTRGKRGKK